MPTSREWHIIGFGQKSGLPVDTVERYEYHFNALYVTQIVAASSITQPQSRPPKDILMLKARMGIIEPLFEPFSIRIRDEARSRFVPWICVEQSCVAFGVCFRPHATAVFGANDKHCRRREQWWEVSQELQSDEEVAASHKLAIKWDHNAPLIALVVCQEVHQQQQDSTLRKQYC